MSTTVAFDFEQARFNMIEQQIRPWEVLDARVLALLSQIKREQFVPEHLQHLALADLEIPLSHTAGECMLPPKAEARALQDLDIQPHHTVLEIGTGSGYMAALMARLGHSVTTLEINPTLATQAQTNLQAAGIDNAKVVTADAAANDFAACKALGSFDAIVLSGSVAQVPQALVDLLKPNGRLFAIVGHAPIMRATLIERTGPNSVHTLQPWDFAAPRLRNFPEPSSFQF
jgi:protein-L-isoaspartate(D-aspartate) O-methyltransferase